MLRRHIVAAAALVDLALFAAAASAQPALAYRVDDLGTPNGQSIVGLAINSFGEIAGYIAFPDGSSHAFRWTESGGLEDLGANGGTTAQALAINDLGEVAGVYIDAQNNAHGFVAPRGGAIRDLYTPERPIWRINAITNDGRLTGLLSVPDTVAQVHAFRTFPDGALEDLGGVFASEGWRINTAGDVSGYEVHDEDGALSRAFRYSDLAGKVDLGTLGGLRSSGQSINASGVVVGWSEAADGRWSRAFRARPDRAMEDLGALNGAGVSGAEAINDAGDIVGWSDSTAGFTAFLYTNARGMIDLRTRMPAAATSGRIVSDAYAINGAGQIVVGYQTADGVFGTLRLTPVVDEQAPSVTLSASPAVLWPPNGAFVPVTINAATIDDYDPSPACAITNVLNTDHLGGGDDPDVWITGPLTLSLRAARRSAHHGRVYLIRVRCTDFSGNATSGYTMVLAPSDR